MGKQYEIKPLVWMKLPYKRNAFPAWTASDGNSLEAFMIARLPGGAYRSYYNIMRLHTKHETLAEAKAACQMHHERHLASTILTEVK